MDLLLTSNFASQKILETILYSLRITDRGRLISIKTLDGQLERDSQGIPYWNVYLQTTALIAYRCLARAISKEFFNGSYYSYQPFKECSTMEEGNLVFDSGI